MKKNHLIVAGIVLGLALYGILFSLYGLGESRADLEGASFSSFEMGSGQVETLASSQTRERKTPKRPPKNGWYEDDKGSYFYEKRKKLTGWQEIEEAWYYFDEEGLGARGFLKEEEVYYLDPDTGRRKEGLLKLGDDLFYFHPESGIMAGPGWLELSGQRYYVGEDGRFKKGQVKLEEGEYLFDDRSGELLLDFSRPFIALTYDDGPLDYCHELLDILDKYSVKASFFFQGYLVPQYPDVVERIYKSGHSIGSHSYNHPNFNLIDTAEILYQIEETDREIEKVIGKKTDWFRSPYGESSEYVRSLIGKPTIHWNVDSQDWMGLSPQEISDNVMDYVRDGAIVLMHDTLRNTIEASDILIPTLLKEGYQLVNLETLFMVKGEKKEIDGLYNGFD